MIKVQCLCGKDFTDKKCKAFDSHQTKPSKETPVGLPADTVQSERRKEWDKTGDVCDFFQSKEHKYKTCYAGHGHECCKCGKVKS